MHMTIDLILDQIDECHILKKPSNVLHRLDFPWITLGEFKTQNTLNLRWLHICDTAHAIEIINEHEGNVPIVCVCENGLIPANLAVFSNNILFMDDAQTPNELFLYLREYLAGVAAWNNKLADLSRDKFPYPKMLESSVAHIGNFISLSDSSYKLIAYTKSVKTDDEVSCKLIENGYHPQETVASFNKYNLAKQWRTDDKRFEICIDSPFSQYETVSHVFRFKQSYFVHLVMTCDHHKITGGMLDLFNMLVTALEPCVQRSWDRKKGFSQPHDSLFKKILNGSYVETREITDQAFALGIPEESAFSLACISFKNADDLNIQEIAWRLVDELPRCKVFIYRNQILVLKLEKKTKAGVSTRSFAFLDCSFLLNYSPLIGESLVFDKLTDLSFAYRQARLAMLFVDHKPFNLYENYMKYGPESDSQASCYLDFGRCLVQTLLYRQIGNEDLIDYSIKQHKLYRIYRDDVENNSAYVKIILAYLTCNNRPSEAAVALHMHRNNVNYHIGQISKKYEIDFSDPKECFELLLVSGFITS